MTRSAVSVALPAAECSCSGHPTSHLSGVASLLATDVLLVKSGMLPEWALTLKLEDRYARAAMLDWSRRANVAIAASVKWLEGVPEVKDEHIAAIPQRLIGGFVGWPGKPLLDVMGSTLRAVAKLAKQAIVKKIEGKLSRSLVLKAETASLTPNFNLEDEKAVDWLVLSQKFWLLDHFDASTVDAIRVAGWVDLKGMPGKDASAKLKKSAEKMYGIGAFDHLGKGYFQGVAVNAATTARVNSSVLAMKEYGVQSYILVNPMDERTSEICKAMDGKELFVSDAHDQLTTLMAAKTPDEIKKVHGWEPKTFRETLKGHGVDLVDGKSLSLKDRHTVGKNGFALPPYHWICRTTVDIGYGGTSGKTPAAPSVAVAPEPAAAKPPAPMTWGGDDYGEDGGPPDAPFVEPVPVPVAKPIPVPKAPKPVVAPIPAPPIVTPTPAVINPGMSDSFPWKPEDLKDTKDGKSLAGEHSKVVLEAPDGSKWLFKPNTHKEKTAYGAEVERFAAKLANKLGQPTAEVHVVELAADHPGLHAMGYGGRKAIAGSVQRMADVKGVIGTIPLDTLTESQLAHIQREHVLDWLISNHDAHEDNHLFLADGSLLGIDKGQAFKFFGRDKWSPDYSPNRSGDQFVPYYNRMFGRYAKGDFVGVKLLGPDENAGLMSFLKSIKDMDEDDFIALIEPYTRAAEQAGIKWGPKGWNASQFQYELLLRKERIIDDARAYYAELEKQRAAFLPALKPKPKTVTTIDKAFAKKVHDSGLHGASIHVADSRNIRSGSILMFGMEGDGTVGELYLSEAGDATLKKALGALAGKVGSPAAIAEFNPYHDDVLKVAKSLYAHLVNEAHSQYDGKVPLHTMDALVKLRDTLRNEVYASNGNIIPGQEGGMAHHYLEYIRGIIGSIQDKPIPDAAVLKSNLLALAAKPLAKYVPPPPPVPGLSAGLADILEVKAIKTTEWDVALAGGGKIRFNSLAGKAYQGDSFQITIKGSKPPITFLYAQHGDHNHASRVGRLRLLIDKSSDKLDPSDVEDALQALKKLGLGSDLAVDKDVEALYLRKVTRIAKLDKDSAFVVKPNATSDEVIDQLSAAWSKRMGVKDVRKLPNYAPNPIYDGPRESGRPRWERFDINIEDIKRAELDLFMDLTSDGSAGEFFRKAVPGGTESMVATESRLRVGIPVSAGQKSATDDMRTGGAERVFTRIGKTTATVKSRRFQFDSRLLLDADAITYQGDMYGNLSVFDEYHLGTTVKGMLEAEKGGMDNETLFKYSMSWKYLKDVGVGNEAERQELIKYLQDSGVTHFGNRAVTDVVKVMGKPVSPS